MFDVKKAPFGKNPEFACLERSTEGRQPAAMEQLCYFQQGSAHFYLPHLLKGLCLYFTQII